MSGKRCCFAGHSEIYSESIKEEIRIKVVELIEKEDVSSFWVGNYGKFDYYAAEVVKELKNEYTHISLELVIPYVTKSINESKEYYKNFFEQIIMADIPEKTPQRCRILKTNEYIINHSDFLICYVHHSWGGASKTLEYAERKSKIKTIRI